MSVERQYSKGFLLIGLMLVILAGNNLGGVFFHYAWNFIAGGIGIFLVLVAIGDLLTNEQMDNRAINLHFLGSVLMGVGPVLMIFAPLALNAQLIYGWVLPVLGVSFLLCGIILILRVRLQTTPS